MGMCKCGAMVALPPRQRFRITRRRFWVGALSITANVLAIISNIRRPRVEPIEIRGQAIGPLRADAKTISQIG